MKTRASINSFKINNLLHSAWRWPLLLVGSALACGLLFFMDIDIPLRPLIGLWFIFVCPGMAIVRAFVVQDALLEWVLALTLSLSLAGIIASLQIYTNTWSPALTLLVLIGITLIGSVAQALLILGIIHWPSVTGSDETLVL